MRILNGIKAALFAVTGAALAIIVGAAGASAQTYGISQSLVNNGQSGTASSTVSSSAASTNGSTSGISSSSSNSNGSITNSNGATSASGTSGSSNGGVFGVETQALFQGDAQNLAFGTRGQSVSELQGFLAELGFLDLSGVGGPTGYYGSMTRDAVARYQAAVGVPSTGYFGPMTKSAMALHFVKNNWLNNLGVNSSTNAGPNTGGADVDFGTGAFSATNPGYTYNGVWYPNQVDMSVRASSANSSGSSSGTLDSNGTASNSSNTSTSNAGSNGTSGTSGNLDYTAAP